ncbi:MAG: cyclic nucleotide-binding domain-containing protein [Microscillaceae bacterium]|nr:cyclic nucleotide-binding domain-containing protein [Microscillaceae bacterium]
MAQQKIELAKVSTGIYWVSVPEADLRVLCGCPTNTVKHLKKRGLIDVIEQDNVKFETGPNAILLSDVLIQNGYLSNLSEFPLLQMLYMQGMLIPNHPNNKGEKPLLLGSEVQIKAQMDYFYRGNYGLINKEEILATGVSEDLADEMMHIKLRFAFGNIRTSDTLVNQLTIADAKVEIRQGVFVQRLATNVFEFSYEDQSVIVDLNLQAKEIYEPPYYLSYYQLNREYFSIVHTGEGDAWDVNRACMASIVIFQGRVYLVDAGPDLMSSMMALGISVNEVAGIFNTHAHDDHFAGLTTFVRSDHKIKYYSSAPVRASVAKKLCALMSVSEDKFHSFFDVQDLELDVWNNIDGLEVMPVLSPHPVETNVFYFRTFWGDSFYTYGHLADVASFRVLENNIFKSDENHNFELALNKTKKDYLIPADLKKIDIGGGLIHGDAIDFSKDPTPKILLAHVSRPLTNEEKQVGSFASFGSVDSMIETQHDFLRSFAQNYLRFYFPEVPDYEIYALLNCPMVSMNAGDTLFRKGSRFTHIYLLLTGAVEVVYPDTGLENSLSAGSLVGFYIDDADITAKATCRASCHSTALQIPVELYLAFVKRRDLVEPFNILEDLVGHLANSWLFSENISLPIYIKIAKKLQVQQYPANSQIDFSESKFLFFIKSGQAQLYRLDNVVDTLKRGDFFGLENQLLQAPSQLVASFTEESEVYQIPQDLVLKIPIVYWKMLITAQKRT